MVASQFPILVVRVRFPLPAPYCKGNTANSGGIPAVFWGTTAFLGELRRFGRISPTSGRKERILPPPARSRRSRPASPPKPPPALVVHSPERIDRNPPSPQPCPCRRPGSAERLRPGVRIGCKHRRQHYRIHSAARGPCERPGRMNGPGDSKFVKRPADGGSLPSPLRQVNALRPHPQRERHVVGNKQDQSPTAAQRGNRFGELFALRMPVVSKDDSGRPGKRLENRQRIREPRLVGNEQKVREFSLVVQERDFFCPRPICLASRERVLA